MQRLMMQIETNIRNNTSIVLKGNGVQRVITCPVLQSPLAGVTDKIFRDLVRRWSPTAVLFTEMVNATSLGLGYEYEKIDNLKMETGPIGVQLFDHRPKAMAEAAQRAEQAGAFLIDINMGCPVKKITKKGGGSGLIRDPQLATQILKAVTEAVSIPVTVKTRLGWCEKSTDPISWCLRLQDAGAQMLTLHGRTREQGFKGTSNWRAIGDVKKALTIPVIANGDVSTPNDALQCLSITGADGVMIGRGTMGAPWLVGQIEAALMNRPIPAKPDSHTRLQIVKEQLQNLVSSRGFQGLLISRKHIGWTCTDFPGAAQLRNSLMHADTLDEACQLLDNAIESLEKNKKIHENYFSGTEQFKG
jgi:nifR3 family TIM-barrel protein